GAGVGGDGGAGVGGAGVGGAGVGGAGVGGAGVGGGGDGGAGDGGGGDGGAGVGGGGDGGAGVGGGGGSPMECSPEATRCVGDVVEGCSGDGHWRPVGCAGWCSERAVGRCVVPPSCREGGAGAEVACGP